MEPPYALIGPGDVVGFAFRAAVLDLSGTAGPGEWQGFYLPEARIFVAPSGLEGLAVSGGVREMWVGIGRHAGVTGLFEAEVVNRGAAPAVRLRLQTATGEWIGVPDAEPPPPASAPEQARLYVDGGVALTTDRAALVVPAVGCARLVGAIIPGRAQ